MQHGGVFREDEHGGEIGGERGAGYLLHSAQESLVAPRLRFLTALGSFVRGSGGRLRNASGVDMLGGRAGADMRGRGIVMGGDAVRGSGSGLRQAFAFAPSESARYPTLPPVSVSQPPGQLNHLQYPAPSSPAPHPNSAL